MKNDINEFIKNIEDYIETPILGMDYLKNQIINMKNILNNKIEPKFKFDDVIMSKVGSICGAIKEIRIFSNGEILYSSLEKPGNNPNLYISENNVFLLKNIKLTEKGFEEK